MNDWQRLDELLERGLDFYGRQLVSEAIQCWREVLYLSPGHRLALEYLEAAGASAEDDFEPPPVKSRSRTSASMPVASEVAAPSEEPPLTLESLSVLAVELIRERRLEEALALLYTAHGEAPKDQAISRSINVIKQKLTREYRAEIGDLGMIPHLTVDEALIDELDMLDEEREVLRLVDGIVALDDVVQTAGLGALQIYRVLAQLLRRNLIVMRPPSAAGAAAAAEPAAKGKRVLDESPRTKTAPFRPVLVPPAPLETSPPPAGSGPKLVSLPPVPEPPKAVAPVAAAPAAEAMPTPLPITTYASLSAPGAPDAPPAPPAAPAAPTTTTMPKAAAAKIATSTALPVPTVPAAPPSPPKATGAVATSVTSVIAASAANVAASSSGVPTQQLEASGSGAFAAILNAVGNMGGASINTDSPPRRPSAYAAHVAEAVRAHLQGHHARAKELLAICIAECPEDPAAKRNLQRLKERLGVKEER